MQEGSGIPNLQTELNYLDSFKSYCNSSDLGFLGSGGEGWVDGGGGGWGVPHTHVHMHVHARTCTHGKHDNFMQMAAPIGGNPWEFPMMSYACACACMRVHVHMCGEHPLTTPHQHPPTPPPPRGGTPGINQNSIALELIEIFQFRLKI